MTDDQPTNNVQITILDILTEFAATGYTHHIPRHSSINPNAYHNVQQRTMPNNPVHADHDHIRTAVLTDCLACIRAWLAAADVSTVYDALLHATVDMTHGCCQLHVPGRPTLLQGMPSLPHADALQEAVTFPVLQHMTSQLKPQLVVLGVDGSHMHTANLFNTMHVVDAGGDVHALVQPLEAPLVLPARCRFLMSDVRRLDVLVQGM